MRAMQYVGSTKVVLKSCHRRSSLQEVFDRRIRPAMPSIVPEKYLTPAVTEVPIVQFNVGEGITYVPPNPETRSFGYVKVNAQKFADFTRSEILGLALNLGNPGHHFRKAGFEPVHGGYPAFLTEAHPIANISIMFEPSAFQPYHAFDKGWGLYSELLGAQLKLYNSEARGMIQHHYSHLLDALRAVVDTGIHAAGWTGDKAAAYLMENGNLSEAHARAIVSEAASYPGLLSAAKVGQTVITNVRSEIRKRMGRERFDVRTFHEDVLACKGPLFILLKCVSERRGLPVPN